MGGNQKAQEKLEMADMFDLPLFRSAETNYQVKADSERGVLPICKPGVHPAIPKEELPTQGTEVTPESTDDHLVGEETASNPVEPVPSDGAGTYARQEDNSATESQSVIIVSEPKPAHGGDVSRISARKENREPLPQNQAETLSNDRNLEKVEELSSSLPEWRLVSLDLIDDHPLLSRYYRAAGLRFPPEVPPDYLTRKGILTAARFIPIHLVVSGERLQCFAGVRFWLAARGALPRQAEIEALVYPEISERLVAEAVELDQDILYIWHRQDEKERRALELKYMSSSSANGLRLNLNGKEQKRWEQILKTSIRTIQNRMTSHRGDR